MKVLDVKKLNLCIEDIRGEASDVQAQISAIQRSVRDLVASDDALKGKTGDSIRSFLSMIHEPFLIFMHQSLTDYSTILHRIQNKVMSYESNPVGLIRQDFIEHEVKTNLTRTLHQTEDVVNEIIQTLRSVSDIIHLQNLDMGEFRYEVGAGKRTLQNNIEQLYDLDATAVKSLSPVKNDLETMRSYVSNIESKFKSGALSVSNYNVHAIKNVAAYDTISNRIKNESKEKKVLEGLSREGQEVIKFARKELDKGNIDKQEYLRFINGIKQFEQGKRAAKVDVTLAKYLKENYKSIGISTYVDTMVETVKHIGSQTKKNGEALKGFPIKKAFHKAGEVIVKGGKYVQGTAAIVGSAATIVGFGFGYYDDTVNKNRTRGEAIVHNSALVGISGGISFGGKIATTIALGSTPVGWAIGIAAAAIGTTVYFNYLYESNTFGIQDKLNSVGQKLDTWGKKAKESAGEAINNIGKAINPMNWSWGR